MTGILNGKIGNGATTSDQTSAQMAGAQMAGAQRDPSDAQMDQIRDLLFGSVRDELMARFEALERRVTELERGLVTARRADVTERRAAFDTLAKGVSDLGTQIRTLAQS